MIEIILPKIKVLAEILVKIISVTRFSFSSVVLVSIRFERKTVIK